MLLDHHDAQPVGELELVGHRRARGNGGAGGRRRDPLRLARRGDDLDRARRDEVPGDDGPGHFDPVVLGCRNRLVLGQILDRRRTLIAQISGGDALHIGRRHAPDRGKLPVGGARIAVNDDRGRDCPALALGRLAAAQHRCQDFVLRLGQFGGGDGRVANPRDFAAQRRLALGGGLAARQDRDHRKIARALLRIEIGLGTLRKLVAIDERLVQPRALALRQDRVQHRQGRAIGMAVRRDRIADQHRGQRRVRLLHDIMRRLGPLGFGDRNTRDRRGRAFDLREILVNPAVQLIGREIARHHQHGIVGPVIGRVERADIVDLRALQIVEAADRPARIRVFGVRDRREIEREELAVRPRIGVLAQLLLHHIAFGREALRLDHEARHAVGLGEQQALEVVGRNRLVIFGVIVIGRGVVVAADVLGQPVELFGNEVARRLEHEMFEHVREARFPGGIVLRSDIVPHLHRYVGRRCVADRIDAETICQRAFGKGDRLDRGRGGAGWGLRRWLCGGGEREQGGAQQEGGTGKTHGGLRTGEIGCAQCVAVSCAVSIA